MQVRAVDVVCDSKPCKRVSQSCSEGEVNSMLFQARTAGMVESPWLGRTKALMAMARTCQRRWPVHISLQGGKRPYWSMCVLGIFYSTGAFRFPSSKSTGYWHLRNIVPGTSASTQKEYEYSVPANDSNFKHTRTDRRAPGMLGNFERTLAIIELGNAFHHNLRSSPLIWLRQTILRNLFRRLW